MNIDLKKLWPTLLPAAALLSDQLVTWATPFIAAHPTLALFLGVLVTAVANVVSPKKDA